MKYRHEVDAGNTERHHGSRMMVHDRVHIGPRLVDAAMDYPLRVEGHARRPDRLESSVNSRRSDASINSGERERDSR